MKELLTAIVKGLVENPDAVNVTVDEKNDEVFAGFAFDGRRQYDGTK